MTKTTVPQDVYQRHEREWQMLREAIAKSQKASSQERAAQFSPPQEKPQWDFQDRSQSGQ